MSTLGDGHRGRTAAAQCRSMCWAFWTAAALVALTAPGCDGFLHHGHGPALRAGAASTRGPAMRLGGSSSARSMASRIGKLASSVFKRARLAGGSPQGRRARGALGARAMFTGIVEEIGQVEELAMDIKTPGVTLTLKGKTVLEGAYEGCSISVNGVCLTVTKFTKDTFTVGVSPETLRVTNLGELGVGDPVNLERAAAMDGRNSGHMVQGHVDDVGDIVETWPDNESLFFKVKVPSRLMQYIVPKGFVAIDGTSLTVCDTNLEESWFTFMLIDYTQKHVIIPGKKDGGKVNIEVDVMSKYVERAMMTINARLDKIEAQLAQNDVYVAHASVQYGIGKLLLSGGLSFIPSITFHHILDSSRLHSKEVRTSLQATDTHSLEKTGLPDRYPWTALTPRRTSHTMGGGSSIGSVSKFNNTRFPTHRHELLLRDLAVCSLVPTLTLVSLLQHHTDVFLAQFLPVELLHFSRNLFQILVSDYTIVDPVRHTRPTCPSRNEAEPKLYVLHGVLVAQVGAHQLAELIEVELAIVVLVRQHDHLLYVILLGLEAQLLERQLELVVIDVSGAIRVEELERLPQLLL
eukprot:CAMPEP_0206245210 /NCGR_PEP_ID=MMETSP0047_2-20121206/18573_1 /ASSEMBLY_ACC=CAM_ASM_000192 /TAXON_ID=195065 /ORGANISM="Chroomonas mesostigmatica_cf, Strain CCMP1168" /LENGTH=576 /DNA_ID=CAMNT_0053670489 /DNA_START=33 /DNA_END=1761 /DNA_ORIENTATION=-